MGLESLIIWGGFVIALLMAAGATIVEKSKRGDWWKKKRREQQLYVFVFLPICALLQNGVFFVCLSYMLAMGGYGDVRDGYGGDLPFLMFIWSSTSVSFMIFYINFFAAQVGRGKGAEESPPLYNFSTFYSILLFSLRGFFIIGLIIIFVLYTGVLA